MRKILATKIFQLDFKRTPLDVQFKTEFALEKLKQNPFNPAFKIKKLKGLSKNLWRIKVDQNYRLIYSLTKDSIILHRIRHRKDIYRNL